ncbi:TetR/AcrR family transcriptional regulator [Micromonospora citrea]|uniref:TetR/AcrR family transcriptional regulator n=1 Tax=Micromonospora citrea TaxID=47855 RepID=UPI003C3FFF70
MTAARRPARARDPEGRRRAIAVAAAQVIAEVGVGRATHRAVAARADVPLGATTYYFPHLADLVAAGLSQAHTFGEALLAEWAASLEGEAELPRALTRLVTDYVADRPRALMESELYLAAAREPALRDLARRWIGGLQDLVAARTDSDTAYAVVALVDGAVTQHLATGLQIDAPRLEAAFTRLCRR